VGLNLIDADLRHWGTIRVIYLSFTCDVLKRVHPAAAFIALRSMPYRVND